MLNRKLLPVLFAFLIPCFLPAQFTPDEARVNKVFNSLTLEEKANLCQGDPGVERFGIPSFEMTDGGRGPHGNGEPVTGFPAGIGMASAWNPDLMYKAGVVWGEEARTLGRTFLLGPACNILRDPLGGRFFEYFSEDPLLTAELAVPAIQGIQSRDVIACVKHFACNNRENNRNDYYSIVDERTLHEIYFPAFKAAVEKADVQAIMTSANGVNFEFVSDSRRLLTGLLRDRWGFDGLIITDWINTRSIEKAAFAGLDKSMPGGENCGFGLPLLDAIRRGTVPESVLDQKVLRMLRAYDRVGLLEPDSDIARGYKRLTPEHIAVAKEVAEEGLVLLKNDKDLLPIDPGRVRRILVTGPNATLRNCEFLMGGSCWVNSPDEVTVLEGVRKSFGDKKVRFFDWAPIGGFQELPDFIDINGMYSVTGNNDPVLTRKEDKINYMWEMRSPDPSIPVENWREARYELSFVAPADGKYSFRISAGGGDVILSDGWKEYAPMAVLKAADAERGTTSAIIDLAKGARCVLGIRYTRGHGDAFLHVEWSTPESQADEKSWKRLESEARKADVVLFVGGLDLNLDTEGSDRRNILFPDLQQEAILRLAKANKNTVVALVNGSPLEIGGWLDKVPAVLECWYGGIEGGTAVASVLTGKINPSGRLTFSWPKAYVRTPKAKLGWENKDYIIYSDSLMVGYRYYDTVGDEPQFPFGYGLSYTSYKYDDLAVTRAADGFKGSLIVSNTGSRDGKEVVQVYVRPLTPSVSRPVHELKAFKKVAVTAGGDAKVEFSLGQDAFSFYDVHSGDWKVDQGRYLIEVGSDSRHILLSKEITVK